MQILLLDKKPYITQEEEGETIYIPLSQYLKNDKVLNVVDSKDKARTIKQNNSLHSYCAKVAKKLNDGGLDIKQTIKADIPWSMTAVKDLMWRVIQVAMLNKKSTTSLKTNEVTQIHRVMDNHLVTKLEISPTDFPSWENQIIDEYLKNN